MSRFAFLAGAAGLVLAACGKKSDGATGAPSAEGTSGVAPPAIGDAGAGVPAPLVGATTVDGAPFDAQTLAGRPTVAWFWAPWCTVCRGEAPDVADVAAAFADRVNFIGVAGRGGAPEMRDFVSDTNTGGFTHLDDSSGDIWAAYEIYAQPAFAFITADGRVETLVGSLGAGDLTSIIDRLLAA